MIAPVAFLSMSDDPCPPGTPPSPPPTRRLTVSMAIMGTIQLAFAALIGGYALYLLFIGLTFPVRNDGGGFAVAIVLFGGILGCFLALAHLAIGVQLLRMRYGAVLACLVTGGVYLLILVMVLISIVESLQRQPRFPNSAPVYADILLIAATVVVIVVVLGMDVLALANWRRVPAKLRHVVAGRPRRGGG